MRTWKDVATLVKPKSAKGKFVARRATDFPFSLAVGDVVAFVPPRTGLPRRGTVSSVRDGGERDYEVCFAEVTERACALGLAGCHCLVERDKIGGAAFEREPALWAGWTVIDEGGTVIGEVATIIENPAQPLLEVARLHADKPAYIPVVDEFICDVDEAGRTVTVRLPAGLLDL